MNLVFIADLIETRKNDGEAPLVGPYDTQKVNPDGTTFTVTTEIWELEVMQVIFKFPPKRLSKKERAELAKKTDEEREDLAKLGRFRRAKARGLGDYLTMDRYAMEVMLVDGLMPTITPDSKASDFVTGELHLRCKVVTSTTGPATMHYLFAKIHPSTSAPTHRLAIFNNDPSEDDLVGLSEDATKKKQEAIIKREEEKERCLCLYGTDDAAMMAGLIPLKA